MQRSGRERWLFELKGRPSLPPGSRQFTEVLSF